MVGWAGMGGILYKILVPSLFQCFLNWLRTLHFLLIDWFIQPCVVSHGGIEFWEIREAILDFFSIPFYYKLKRSGPSISLYAHGIISMRTSQKSSFPPKKKDLSFWKDSSWGAMFKFNLFIFEVKSPNRIQFKYVKNSSFIYSYFSLV